MVDPAALVSLQSLVRARPKRSIQTTLPSDRPLGCEWQRALRHKTGPSLDAAMDLTRHGVTDLTRQPAGNTATSLASKSARRLALKSRGIRTRLARWLSLAPETREMTLLIADPDQDRLQLLSAQLALVASSNAGVGLPPLPLKVKHAASTNEVRRQLFAGDRMDTSEGLISIVLIDISLLEDFNDYAQRLGEHYEDRLASVRHSQSNPRHARFPNALPSATKKDASCALLSFPAPAHRRLCSSATRPSWSSTPPSSTATSALPTRWCGPFLTISCGTRSTATCHAAPSRASYHRTSPRSTHLHVLPPHPLPSAAPPPFAHRRGSMGPQGGASP
jgi:hypothetical protein